MEIVTYVDFVDPKGHAHKAGLRSGTENVREKNNNNKTHNLPNFASFVVKPHSDPRGALLIAAIV